MGFEMADITTDSWLPYKVNMTNFGVAWGLYFTFVHLRVHEWVAIIVVLLLELGWQLVQAYVDAPSPFSYDGSVGAYLGGSGFNYANAVWAVGGMTLAFLIDLMQPPVVRPLGGYDVDPCAQWEKNDDDYNECYDALADLIQAYEDETNGSIDEEEF